MTDQNKFSPQSQLRLKKYALETDDQANQTWLISFTDVIALMLTFFVLLFSMSQPKNEEWNEFTEKVQENFNKYYGQVRERSAQDSINIERINFSQALNVKYLKALFTRIQEEEDALKIITMQETEDRLIVSLPQNLLFDAGQATIKNSANRALIVLAGTLRRIQNRVEVIGHTDPTPTRGGYGYASNWELSLARASQVAAVLENAGYDRPMIIRGQASGQFLNLSPDIPRSTRMETARRVDIVIMDDNGNIIR